MPITLDVWSDLVCPWCFIGKRRLEAALAEEPPGAVEVRWHAFQLQPDIPPEGVDAEPYFRAKFGSDEQIAEMRRRVSGIAAGDGLDLNFAAQRRAPNTLLAHRAVKLAPDQDAAIEALFKAHFTDGEDIGDRDTVLRLVPGVDPAALDRGDGAEAVANDLEAAAEIGVGGVPFFVAAGRVALSGAHEPALLRKLVHAGRDQSAAA
ncbi:MAG TPA: DsbA family oxidoreductase [Capillimicrobium sp.]|jgi:predicted DsbA family dithiol-disulfide isomerase